MKRMHLCGGWLAVGLLSACSTTTTVTYYTQPSGAMLTEVETGSS